MLNTINIHEKSEKHKKMDFVPFVFFVDNT